MRKFTALIIALLMIGILINFIPVSTYVFNTYPHEKYHDSFQHGISLEYYGVFGSFSAKNGTSYYYGVTINITKMGSEHYEVGANLYQIYPTSQSEFIFNGNKLPGIPFLGYVKQIDHYGGNLTGSEYALINLLFPNGNKVNAGTQNFSISSNETTMSPESYTGFPSYYFGQTNFLKSEISYVNFGTQHVMAYYLSSDSNSTVNFFTSLTPNFHFNISSMEKTHSGPMILNIGRGNDSPGQNWAGWFEYGFGFVFPLNVVLLISSGVLSIYLFRRVN
jgi:hypothetical protein